jgi:hypothetical protein
MQPAVQRPQSAPITAPAAEVTRIPIVDDLITAAHTVEKRNILEAAGYDVLTANKLTMVLRRSLTGLK